jgi:ABC-type branched-subunit amino acid transport system ATPase component
MPHTSSDQAVPADLARTSGQPASADAPLLVADSVMVRYRSGAIGVHDISLEVRAAQVVALFGPNGAGKSTTVRAVSGFVRTEGAKVVRGRVTFGGTDITHAEPHKTCHLGISLVPERRKVFANLTVDENLTAVGKQAPRGAAGQARREEAFELFPVLAERRKALAGRLSGGQQQMLAIARALLSDPRLLIVDEMTLGLHHSLHEPLFEAVRKIAQAGRSVLIVDESTGLALDAADHCYLLGGGHVRDSGPREKFAGNELLMAGYVEV